MATAQGAPGFVVPWLLAALLAAGPRGAEPFGAAPPASRGRAAAPARAVRAPAAPQSHHPRLARLALRAASAPGGETWWEARGSVPFACTECGKCCQVRGDVWASPDDAARLAAHLGMTVQALADEYGKLEVEGWIQMRDRPEGGCIFLAEDGKACGVYEGRPVQCRVYPFFPRILKTPEGWNGVCVRVCACVRVCVCVCVCVCVVVCYLLATNCATCA